MQLLSPAESLYLISPFTSPSGELIKLCLQDLCFHGVLAVEERWMQLHPSDPHQRLRLLFHQGENFNKHTPTRAEAFLLVPFKKYPTLQFFQLRNYVAATLKKKLNRFKANYLYADISKKGYCYWHYFLTAKGQGYSRHMNAALDEIEENVDTLIASTPDVLIKKLEALRGNIFLLDKETQQKLKALEYTALSLSQVNFTSSLVSAFSTYGSYLGSGIYSFGGSGASSGGAGDFGGFGGGDFGGAGAGGEW